MISILAVRLFGMRQGEDIIPVEWDDILWER